MPTGVTYIDVILPLSLPRAYTYAVPFDMVEFIKTGQRVIVQFGKNRYYSAIVRRIHNEKPSFEPKLIESIAEEEAIVTETQLKFWEWMADYYMCHEGEVMNAALPSGLKLSSETKIRFNEDYEGDFETLNEQEFLIVQALRAQSHLSIEKVQELLQKKNVYPQLKTLFNLGIAVSSEELIEKFKPRTEIQVKLNGLFHEQEKLELLFEELGRAPKQLNLLLAFVQLEKKAKFIKKSELLALSKSDAATLKRLVDKGVFIEFKMETSRLGNIQTAEVETGALSAEQQQALHEINAHFETKNVVLLHGVTGSGKTNIYIEKISEIIKQDKQALYLLPEIALTAQIINRLRKVFGGLVGVYHSKFNKHERVEIWNKVLRNEYKIVLGARSGLFLPFQQLGLVIVDEEQDSSLKQQDPAPRYNGRDAGIMLASMFNAKVILGSATPAIESYYNAMQHKYGLVELKQRYGGLELPLIEVVDIKRERKRLRLNGSFTTTLIDTINAALQNREQVILFLNRRGFANFQVCRTCNFVYKCKNCDVSLTYHKYQHKLICHYCGYSEKVGEKCKSCGAADLEIVGIGTEKIEDEMGSLFPAAHVARMDYDTTKTKYGHADVIARFENHEIDVLVGTQMVTKGLDFDNVSLVGIMNADQLINHPGFRSHERAFQTMMQVAGRAGRKNKQGKVMLQASNIESEVVKDVVNGDYRAMYESELKPRSQFGYPPFLRIIEMTLRSKNVQQVEQAALFLANEIRKTKQCIVLGPSQPFVSRVNTFYLREILVKISRQATDLHLVKKRILQAIDKMKTVSELKAVQVSIDVDP